LLEGKKIKGWHPRYARTRAKAFRGFDWKFSQVPEIFVGLDWSASVERKFFPNDRAEVVTVNLDQPDHSPVQSSPYRLFLFSPFITRRDPSPRVHRVTQKNNASSIIFEKESMKFGETDWRLYGHLMKAIKSK
jgi:hypothetical protein